MSASQAPVAIPPVEALVGEVIATLVYAAQAYLGEGQDPAKPADFVAADLAIEVAAHAFESVQPRLRVEERSTLAGMLTELRMAYVRKRGL
jgi:hypothetical protein